MLARQMLFVTKNHWNTLFTKFLSAQRAIQIHMKNYKIKFNKRIISKWRKNMLRELSTQIDIPMPFIEYSQATLTELQFIKMRAQEDQQIQLGQKYFQVPNLLCSNGHKIERFCYNQACKYDALCCAEESCQCDSRHLLCSFKKLRHLSKYVQDRLSLNSKILRELFSIQNELMNNLMANRKLIIQQSKRWRLGNYYGLIDSIYFKNSIKGIKGKEMKELISELSQAATAQKEVQLQLSTYRDEGEKFLSKLQRLRSDLLLNLQKEKREEKYSIPSKILAEDKDGHSKYLFLLKQLSNPQLKLLFRASQHNFSAKQFQRICQGIGDTVTIVRTEFDRTIAAYTPLKWGTIKDGYATDDSQSSFLLQLELREKMMLTEPQKAIYNHPSLGPVFGGGYDICIADQCDQNKNSGSIFPHSYNYNGKYQKNQQSYTAFCGNLQGYGFRVIEYEVFAVTK